MKKYLPALFIIAACALVIIAACAASYEKQKANKPTTTIVNFDATKDKLFSTTVTNSKNEVLHVMVLLSTNKALVNTAYTNVQTILDNK